MSTIPVYQHTVQYYETDKMGIVHHANYLRWMEEARVYFLNQIGWGYDKLEEMGIVSPMMEINCQYKRPTYFPEVISITVSIEELKGMKSVIRYTMLNERVETVCVATSTQAFLHENMRPIRLKKEFPDFYAALEAAKETN